VCPKVLTSCGAWMTYETQAPCEIGVFEPIVTTRVTVYDVSMPRLMLGL